VAPSSALPTTVIGTPNRTVGHSIGPVRATADFRYQGEVRHHTGRPAYGNPMPAGGFPPGQASAFAEGRRLRESSRRRRQQHGRHPYVAGRRHRPHAVLPLLLIVVAIAMSSESFEPLLLGAAGVGLFATMLVWLFSPVLLVGALAFTLVRRGRRRESLRRGGAPGTAPLPGRPAAAPRPDLVWAHAQRRFHGLRGEYAAYECDAMQVLRLPALADVSVASTARFVDAFAEAQALETDAYPGGTHAPQFVAAVDRAERAWRAAHDAAERIRLSGLSPAERSTVERVIKLLTTARDSDSDAERLTAYARARSELAKLDKAGVVHVPIPARTALDEAARGALPA
jgi:hypothetical protein